MFIYQVAILPTIFNINLSSFIFQFILGFVNHFNHFNQSKMNQEKPLMVIINRKKFTEYIILVQCLCSVSLKIFLQVSKYGKAPYTRQQISTIYEETSQL